MILSLQEVGKAVNEQMFWRSLIHGDTVDETHIIANIHIKLGMCIQKEVPFYLVE